MQPSLDGGFLCSVRECVNKMLSDSQKKIKESTNFKSWLFGLLASLVMSFFAITFLPEGATIRIPSLIVFIVIALLPAQKIIYNVLSSGLRCKVCNAQFAINHINSRKDFLSAIPRKRIKNEGKVGGHGPDVGKQIILHESWTEERYKVTDTYSCVECSDTYESTSISTNRAGYSSTKIRK